MARYLKVKRNTKLYEALLDFHTDYELIEQNKENIKNIIKCELDWNLALSTNLRLKNVPDELKSEFRKNPDNQGFYAVKTRSKLKKEWDKLIEETKIKFIDIRDIVRKFNLLPIFTRPEIKQYYEMHHDFYFEVDEQKNKNENIHQDTELITELKFLKIRVDYLKELENAEKMQRQSN